MCALLTTTTNVSHRFRARLARLVFPCAVIFGASATTVDAIVIDGGPDFNPPGGAVFSFSGDAALAGGATVTYTGIDLSQTANLYFGIRNDTDINGYSMDGGTVSGAEVFRISQVTPSSIVYTGETVFHTDFPVAGVWTTPTRMTLTFSGTGSLISDPTTQALNGPLGDVHALWWVQESELTMSVEIEAMVPPFDPNAGNYEPANELFNRMGSLFSTSQSYDWGFYYETLSTADSDGDGVADVADNCIQIANADQRDTDGDGIGSLCDADISNDCVVNFIDLGEMKSVFFSGDANADLNGDSAVNFLDLGIMKEQFFRDYAIDNPSGIPNICDGS